VFVNGSRWSSPETDQLMDRASVNTDPLIRGRQYVELVKRVSDASPVVYVLELRYPAVINKQFKRVIDSPLGIYGNFATAHRE
jgi:peptide/nickel transport system substrate-binding protein